MNYPFVPSLLHPCLTLHQDGKIPPQLSEEAVHWADSALHAQLRVTIFRNFATRQVHLDKIHGTVEQSLNRIHKVAFPKAETLIAARTDEMVADYQKKLEEYKSLVLQHPGDNRYVDFQKPEDALLVQELGAIELEARKFHRDLFLRSRLSSPTSQSELILPTSERAELSEIFKIIGILPTFVFVDARVYVDLHKQKPALHKLAAKVDALIARYGAEKLLSAVREVEFFENAINRVVADVINRVLRDGETSSIINDEIFKLNWELPLACPHKDKEYPILAEAGKFEDLVNRHYRSAYSDPIFSISLDMSALYVLGGCNVTPDAKKANFWLQKAASLETARENAFLNCILFNLSKKTNEDVRTIKAIERLSSGVSSQSCNKTPLLLM